jgi:Flp pilus assembly protein TadG
MSGRFDIWRDERGATTAEFAMVLVVLFALVFGTIGLSFAVWAQETLQYATEATARCVAVSPSLCTNVQSYGTSQYNGPNISPTFASVAIPGCTNGVQGTATFPLNAVLVQKSLSLSAQACFP